MIDLIAVQHRLPSLLYLLSEIERLSIVEKATLVSKKYSRINFPICYPWLIEQDTIPLSFSQHSQKMLFLDEGGLIYDALADGTLINAAGVEQTSSGYRYPWKYPTILTCRSASKLFFESQIISRGIIRKLNSLNLPESSPVGIIGLGALGRQLATQLLKQGYQVLASEISFSPIAFKPYVVSLAELISKCNLILGCSGTDSLSSFDWESCSGYKIFASCSSSDIEFKSLFIYANRTELYQTVRGAVGGVVFDILNGGYPVNFDRNREWERPDEIILTRNLVLEGLLQASNAIGGCPKGIMQDPCAQLNIVHAWLESVPESTELDIPSRLDESFFRIHSEGELDLVKKPYRLHHTTPKALHMMRTHQQPYYFNMNNIKVVVYPGVWSPAYDWSALFHLENLPDVCGLTVCEIGSGTGILSTAIAKRGASKVVAVDVNPLAVLNTRANFLLNSVFNATAYESDVFSMVSGVFDLIIWNAPYHGSMPLDMLERGCADYNYDSIRMFFASVLLYLSPGGKIVFGFSESGDLALVQDLITESGLLVKRKISDWREGYNCIHFELIRVRVQAHVDPSSF